MNWFVKLTGFVNCQQQTISYKFGYPHIAWRFFLHFNFINTEFQFPGRYNNFYHISDHFA